MKDIDGALPPQTTLKPGEDISGWIYVPRHADGWPFALVHQWTPSTDPAHVLLLPAIGREGAKKTPGKAG
ncbi:MAG: hypothetical protein M5R36_07805 [Deltaproteobacteria bacterium]|nr:hypothetical protein [Deltaproteobacteria bacterium]